jgi:hypothetical protein
MGFDPCNFSLKIWKSIGTLTPKVEAPLGVWGFIPSHFPTLPEACDMTPGLPSWPATLQALALVVSPRLGLWQGRKIVGSGYIRSYKKEEKQEEGCLQGCYQRGEHESG